MPTIIGISGSLRRASFNTMLLRAAVEAAPAGTTIEVASIDAIPLYHGDVEAEQGVPQPVRELKERIAAADGLLLVTPEYNNSIPGVMKNTIDWLSRPQSDIARVFRNCPVGVIGATPGPGMTIAAQLAWLAVLRVLGTMPFFGSRVAIARASGVFDADGRIIDDAVRVQLQAFITAFAAFVEEHRRQ
jgi:NAD(P)H-dependent FMN reductase